MRRGCLGGGGGPMKPPQAPHRGSKSEGPDEPGAGRDPRLLLTLPAPVLDAVMKELEAENFRGARHVLWPLWASCKALHQSPVLGNRLAFLEFPGFHAPTGGLHLTHQLQHWPACVESLKAVHLRRCTAADLALLAQTASQGSARPRKLLSGVEEMVLETPSGYLPTKEIPAFSRQLQLFLRTQNIKSLHTVFLPMPVLVSVLPDMVPALNNLTLVLGHDETEATTGALWTGLKSLLQLRTLKLSMAERLLTSPAHEAQALALGSLKALRSLDIYSSGFSPPLLHSIAQLTGLTELRLKLCEPTLPYIGYTSLVTLEAAPRHEPQPPEVGAHLGTTPLDWVQLALLTSMQVLDIDTELPTVPDSVQHLMAAAADPGCGMVGLSSFVLKGLSHAELLAEPWTWPASLQTIKLGVGERLGLLELSHFRLSQAAGLRKCELDWDDESNNGFLSWSVPYTPEPGALEVLVGQTRGAALEVAALVTAEKLNLKTVELEWDRHPDEAASSELPTGQRVIAALEPLKTAGVEVSCQAPHPPRPDAQEESDSSVGSGEDWHLRQVMADAGIEEEDWEEPFYDGDVYSGDSDYSE